jgi:hypothetical protein
MKLNKYVLILSLALFVMLFYFKEGPSIHRDNVAKAIREPVVQAHLPVSGPVARSPAAPRPENTPNPVYIKNPEEPRQLSSKEVEELREETKAFLSSIYTSQKAFQAEYNQYTTDLVGSGMVPSSAIIPFKAGFLEPSEESNEISPEENINARRLSTDSFIGDLDDYSHSTFQYAPFVREIDLDSYKDYCKHGCTADKQGFEMLIATPLGNSGQIDVWIVNDNKEIILVKDGTKSEFQ